MAIHRLDKRSDLIDWVYEVDSAWPEFMGKDLVANALLAGGGRVPALVRGGSGRFWGGGVRWTPTAAASCLTAGSIGSRSGHSNDRLHGRTPDTGSAVEIAVGRAHQGSGLSHRMLAAPSGWPGWSPVRPAGKHRYPAVPMADYLAMRPGDGLPADPWLRVHARAGTPLCGSRRLDGVGGSLPEWSVGAWLSLGERPGDSESVVCSGPVECRGMAGSIADAELARFLADMYAHPAPPAAEVGPEALRAAAEERAATRPPGPEMNTVVDVVIPPGDVSARLYRPVAGPVPLVVYLHGGGWVIGSVATHDRACRRLAAASGAAVLSIDYRRAPEHPWPAAVDDTLAALRWVATRPAVLDPHPTAVAVAGDSAGATTATLACLRARDEEPAAAPGLQVLLYANTDLTNSGASIQTEGHGYGLEVPDIEWSNAQWAPDPAMRRDPRVSPLFAPDLRGLPATIVITCEHDPLRDQGEAYAQRLQDANVPTTLRREPGMVHNFLLWDLISPACAQAADRVAADLRSAFSAPPNDAALLDRT